MQWFVRNLSSYIMTYFILIYITETRNKTCLPPHKKTFTLVTFNVVYTRKHNASQMAIPIYIYIYSLYVGLTIEDRPTFPREQCVIRKRPQILQSITCRNFLVISRNYLQKNILLR